MRFIFSLRRSLLILVVVAAGLGLGQAPAAEARVHAPAPHRIVRPSEGPTPSGLALLRQVLHGIWEAAGSSMDPLGNH